VAVIIHIPIGTCTHKHAQEKQQK